MGRLDVGANLCVFVLGPCLPRNRPDSVRLGLRFLKRYTIEAARESFPGCLSSCQRGTDKQPLSNRLRRVFEYGPRLGPWLHVRLGSRSCKRNARLGRGNVDGSERNRSYPPKLHGHVQYPPSAFIVARETRILQTGFSKAATLWSRGKQKCWSGFRPACRRPAACGGSRLIRKAAGNPFPGWDPRTSHLIAEIELAKEPEWDWGSGETLATFCRERTRE